MKGAKNKKCEARNLSCLRPELRPRVAMSKNPKFETISNDRKAEKVSSDECQGTGDFALDTRPSTLVTSDFDPFESRSESW
jgi:hypothetical protein